MPQKSTGTAMMTKMSETMVGNADSVKVGSTGTVGSLMTRELQATKEEPQRSLSLGNKPQSAPVSVRCGSTPRRSQPMKNRATGPSCSSDGNSDSNGRNPGNPLKLKSDIQRNGCRAPMLGTEGITSERNTVRGVKKVGSFRVEVVDLKCNSPMSSRLKKLGFSKLSESAHL